MHATGNQIKKPKSKKKRGRPRRSKSRSRHQIEKPKSKKKRGRPRRSKSSKHGSTSTRTEPTTDLTTSGATDSSAERSFVSDDESQLTESEMSDKSGW